MPDRLQRRLDAGHELLHPERLREVVVGADLEAVHLVVLRPSRRDHDDRDRDPLLAQRARDPPAVLAGQHQVDHRDVGALEPDLARAPGRRPPPTRRPCRPGAGEPSSPARSLRRPRRAAPAASAGIVRGVRPALPDQRFAAPAGLSSPGRTSFRVTSTARPPGFDLLGCPRRRRGKGRGRGPLRKRKIGALCGVRHRTLTDFPQSATFVPAKRWTVPAPCAAADAQHRGQTPMLQHPRFARAEAIVRQTPVLVRRAVREGGARARAPRGRGRT